MDISNSPHYMQIVFFKTEMVGLAQQCTLELTILQQFHILEMDSWINIIKREELAGHILPFLRSYSNLSTQNSNTFRGNTGRVKPTVSLQKHGELGSSCIT